MSHSPQVYKDKLLNLKPATHLLLIPHPALVVSPAWFDIYSANITLVSETHLDETLQSPRYGYNLDIHLLLHLRRQLICIANSDCSSLVCVDRLAATQLFLPAKVSYPRATVSRRIV